MSGGHRAVPPERLAALRQLMAEGLSWGEIGKRLGVSKHAVSGMVRRHVYGIAHGYRNPALADMPRQVGVREERRRIAAAKAAVAAPVVLPPEITPVAACQWPLGRKRPWRFCEAATEPGLPYCAQHARVAYVHAQRQEAA